MNPLFLCLIIFAINEFARGDGVYLSTCARMDVPILEKAARLACIASCSAQNCGTGYCENRGGRKTCVCSRCDKGGNFPLDTLINMAGKRGK